MYVMARYPAEHKGATRERIVAASERLIKERGAQAASVEAVMRAAGLTVGGFYAHFDSKDALTREALSYGIERSFGSLTAGLDDLDDRAWLRAVIKRYFAQLDDPQLALGCPMTLSLADVAREDVEQRTEFAARMGALVRSIQHRFPAMAGMSPMDVALAVFAALVGAVSLGRVVARPDARPRIIESTEKMLYAFLGLGSPTH